jgi:type II secretory pathway pseudopilin PulG
MVELALTFTIIAVMAAMMIPKFGRVMQATRVNRSIAIVAADMEAAFTLAGRQRKPMRISCDCANARYTIADRTGGTVRLSRALVGDDDLGSMTLTFSETPVDVFPNGVAAIAGPPFTVTITSGASTKSVTVTTAGYVRIVQ